MRNNRSVVSVPPLEGDEARAQDFKAALRYLRYYQRGFVVFAVIVVLGVAAEYFLPAGAIPAGSYRWGGVTLAAGATLYVAAPYWRKVATLYRKQIRPLFALLPEQR